MNTHAPHYTDYQAIEADSADELSREVMRAIRNRWQPHGDMAVARTGDGASLKLYQPMVQHAEWFT